MVVLSPNFPGFVCECVNCHAILGYIQQDIYGSKFVYCPICHAQILTNVDLSYDGVVNNGSKDS